MTSVPDHTVTGGSVPAVAALYVRPANAQHLMTAVTSLRTEAIHVVAGGPSLEALGAFGEVGCECVSAENVADLINETWRLHRRAVLVVGDAITVADDFLGRAFGMMASDPRVASVSFLSNDAGFLSFPERNVPVERLPDGQDADSVTRQLRRLGPHTLPTLIPGASGAAVLLASSALSVIGELRIGPRGELAGTLADFSARAHARGLVHLLDDSTFYLRHRTAGDSPHENGTHDDMHPDEREWFNTLHPNEAAYIDHETSSHTS
ncbi:MAG TPA: hypothetical protein VK773_00410, partial [Acidimicrobiales bacterium]|nr:hypothetical protein [Acidimicrobiales bacterium]